MWLVLTIFSNISISFLVFLCFNRPVVWWFSYLGLVLGFLFPNVYCIILVLSGWSFLFRRGETGNALVNSAVLGSKCFFKHHLLFSLHDRRKFTPHAWEEKRYNLISYLSPFFTLRPDECLPGGQWLSSPPAKAFPSVCGGWESSSSDHSVSAAGRRQHLHTRHSAVCNSLLSSAMGAIPMERVTPVLCVCSSLGTLPKACLPPLWTCPRYGLDFDKLLAWEQLVGALILGSVTGQCTRLLHVERNNMTFNPFVLAYATRTCLLCFVFRFFFSTEPQEVHGFLLTFFTFLSKLLNFK